jgi:hypothetical protein
MEKASGHYTEILSGRIYILDVIKYRIYFEHKRLVFVKEVYLHSMECVNTCK